jgi:hypothetical protein
VVVQWSVRVDFSRRDFAYNRGDALDLGNENETRIERHLEGMKRT